MAVPGIYTSWLRVQIEAYSVFFLFILAGLACGYLSSTGSLMIDRFINAINLVLTVTVLT